MVQAGPDLRVPHCELDAELEIADSCPDTGSVGMRNRINIVRHIFTIGYNFKINYI